MRVSPLRRAPKVAIIGGNKPLDLTNLLKTLRLMEKFRSISAFFSCVTGGLFISSPSIRGLPVVDSPMFDMVGKLRWLTVVFLYYGF